MTPDNPDLPYAFTVNTREGSILAHGLAAIAALALLAIDWFGLADLPTWLIVLPAGLMLLRWFLFSLITNAVHHALRNAERDSYLDETVSSFLDARDIEDRKVSLTPGFFSEKLFPQVPN